MEIAQIGQMVTAQGTPDPKNTKEVAVAFDAMLIELLLRQSNLLQSLSGEEGAEAPFASEMFLQEFAKELAQRMDLGYGSLLVKQAGEQKDG